MPRHCRSWPSTIRRLFCDVVTLARLSVTSRARLSPENLLLRKQPALYQERRTKPTRPDPATRVVLVLLSRHLDWRSLLTVVQRPGRPPIPMDLERLIVTMAQANPSWGEEGIANELLLKLGLAVSPRTVGRYAPSVRGEAGDGPSAGRHLCGIIHLAWSDRFFSDYAFGRDLRP